MKRWECPSCTLRTHSEDTVTSRVCNACRRWCHEIPAEPIRVTEIVDEAGETIGLVVQTAPAEAAPRPPRKPVILIEDYSAIEDERRAELLRDMVWN